jgi:phosphopantothenoylcysteine decarboxylase
MANVLLGVTGSVAAIKTPELFAELNRRGHAVRIVATRAATYFFDSAAIQPRDGRRNPTVISLDEDEWPGDRYARGDAVLHIELRRWADVFVIAPLDANTLAKLSAGICDNCLTCVWRAWDPAHPVILAPAMNTLMWEHPLTRRHLRAIAIDSGTTDLPDNIDQDSIIPLVNERSGSLRIVAPVSKALACGDVGVGAMASVGQVADAVELILAKRT